MASYVAKFKQPHELLNHILDQPELPAIIQRLDPDVLARLIHHIGLEDSAEIVALASVAQLKAIFDEDLWTSAGAGREEIFNSDRFGLWLEVMIETGAAFAARKIMELDEDMVTLALSRLVLVIDFKDISTRMSDAQRSAEDDMVGKVLESTLSQEFGRFMVLARRHDRWDAVLTLLAELNELDYDLMSRLLEHCCRISWEYIEDNGGLYNVFSADEMLEEDMAAERQARRESRGFVSASAASQFLFHARSTPLKEIIAAKSMDHATRAYFKALDGQTGPAVNTGEKSSPSDTTAAKHTSPLMARFLKTLRDAEVLPVSDQKLLGGAEETTDHHLPLAKAMRLISRSDEDLYTRRLMELTYLSNVLISGCEFQSRCFRPVEAAEAAFSVCNLGAAYRLEIGENIGEDQMVEDMAALLAENHLVKLFQVGWKILYENVLLFAAEELLNYFDHPKDCRREFMQTAELLKSCLAEGRPWAFCEQFENLVEHWLSFLDGNTVLAIAALLKEYPTLSDEMISGRTGSGVSIHIWSLERVHLARQLILKLNQTV